MNVTQKQSLLNTLEAIKEIDLIASIKAYYPEEEDLRSIHFGKYSSTEIVTLLEKSIHHFKNELEQVTGLILPIQQSLNNEYGVINIQSTFNSILTNLNNGDFASVAMELDKIIFYQLSLGLWRIETPELTNKNDLNETLNSLKLAKASIENLINQSTLLKEDYSSTIDDLRTFFIEKKLELTEIKDLWVKASNEETQISSLLNESETIKSSISNLYIDQQKRLDDEKLQFEKQIENYEKNKKNFDILGEFVSERLNLIEDNLNKTGESYFFMKGQEAEIKKLTGYAADGSLGSKFDERKKELDNSLKFWLKAIICTTIISVLWVIVVFVYFRIITSNPYLDLFINLLKTTPSFILLGFVFKRYNHERTIQEEYAFKSSVAMTLTAYSEMLQNADEENNKSRQTMLTNAIQEVYKQPKIHNDKESKVFSFNTKHLSNTVKSLTEVVKEIKK